MRRNTVFFILIILVMLCSCKHEISQKELVIASWNLQNLFDSVDDGTEGSYREYTSFGSWDDRSYRQRLEKAIKVLNTGKLKEANIIVLNEIENDRVARDIINSREMTRRGFSYYALAKQKNAAISLGVISSVPIEYACIHETDYRPILEVSFSFQGQPLTILAIHAKSRLEGEEETWQIRRNTAETLVEIAQSVLLESPHSMVMIAGDFNDSYYDDCMMSLIKGRAPLEICSSSKGNEWYCFWADSEKSIWPSGSYYYSKKDSWEAFDNILVMDVSSILDITDSGVLFEGIIRTADSKPNAFVRNLLTGVSDHLPVWVSVF